MALKMPKISVKPVTKWTVEDVVQAASMGNPIQGVSTKAATDYQRKQKTDAAAKQARKGEAAQAASEAMAADYDTERGVGRSALERIANTTVPGVTAASLDPRFRDSQLALMEQLTAQAQGKTPSLAQMQFQQAGNTALQKAMGAIRAATGTNAALGGRTAALASTNMLGNLAAESGMMRLKEQQDAQSALAQLASAGRTGDLQTRQQDIGLGTSNADIAMRNLQTQAAAAGGLLDETGRRYEGVYNRGAQVETAKAGRGGQAPGILPAILGAGGAIIGAKYGGPAGGIGGAAAGKAAGQQMEGGASLVGPTQSRGGLQLVARQPSQKTKVKADPFGRVMR